MLLLFLIDPHWLVIRYLRLFKKCEHCPLHPLLAKLLLQYHLQSYHYFCGIPLLWVIILTRYLCQGWIVAILHYHHFIVNFWILILRFVDSLEFIFHQQKWVYSKLLTMFIQICLQVIMRLQTATNQPLAQIRLRLVYQELQAPEAAPLELQQL